MDERRRAPLSLVESGVEVRFYGERVARQGGPVLVLGCAHGTIAWEACVRGAPTLAVDPSPWMIQAADERRISAPAELSSRLRLLRSDLRSLRLPEKFSLVLAPQNAPGLMASLGELESLFATVRHHLADGGAFIFDVPNPPGHAGGQNFDGAHRTAHAALLARPEFLPHLRERQRTHRGVLHAGIRRLRLRPFLPEEMDEALRQAGLVALERYGNFEGKPFEPKDVTHLVVAGVL